MSEPIKQKRRSFGDALLSFGRAILPDVFKDDGVSANVSNPTARDDFHADSETERESEVMNVGEKLLNAISDLEKQPHSDVDVITPFKVTNLSAKSDQKATQDNIGFVNSQQGEITFKCSKNRLVTRDQT